MPGLPQNSELGLGRQTDKHARPTFDPLLLLVMIHQTGSQKIITEHNPLMCLWQGRSIGADAGGGGGVSIGAERALSANRVTAGAPAQNGRESGAANLKNPISGPRPKSEPLTLSSIPSASS